MMTNSAAASLIGSGVITSLLIGVLSVPVVVLLWLFAIPPGAWLGWLCLGASLGLPFAWFWVALAVKLED